VHLCQRLRCDSKISAVHVSRLWAVLDDGVTVPTRESEWPALVLARRPARPCSLSRNAGAPKPGPLSAGAQPSHHDHQLRYLSPDERVTIADLHRDGLSSRAIAEQVGRSPSTVNRELVRNTGPGGRYGPGTVLELAAREPQLKRHPTVGLVDTDEDTLAWLQGLTRDPGPCNRWSWPHGRSES